MRSPLGSRKALEAITLESDLVAYRCPETGGHYLPAISYLRWLAQQPAILPQLPPEDLGVTEEPATERPYLCPETDTLMTKFTVGHGFPFKIDRSITGGIWLDPGEWEALRSRNFHDELHLIFTAPWQRRVLLKSNEESARHRLKLRLGDALFDRVTTLRHELKAHPHREEVLAYLNVRIESDD